MKLSRKEIMDYVAEASAKKTKEIAMLVVSQLDDNQLNMLQRHFKKKVDFVLRPQKPAEKPKIKPKEPHETIADIEDDLIPELPDDLK